MKPQKFMQTDNWLGFQLLLGLYQRYWHSLILLAILVLSALAVIYMSFQNLTLMNQIGSLERERDKLDIERRNLRLEQSAISEHSRIEMIAREKLSMELIDIEKEHFVRNEHQEETK